MIDNFIEYIQGEVEDRGHIFHSEYPEIVEKNKQGKVQINDARFAEVFLDMKRYIRVNGVFYGQQGALTDAEVRRELTLLLYPIIKVNMIGQVNKIFSTMIDLANVKNYNFFEEKRIPLANGDLILENKDKWKFRQNKFQISPYRLPVNFKPLTEYKEPKNFIKWLKDTFFEDDIETIHEYLGYCLLPTTQGQKTLIIIGDGGVGKSIISRVLRSLLGKAMISPVDINSFFNDKFKIAELENKLVVYEDDLTEKGLENTTVFKKLITNSGEMMAERKGKDPFYFTPYSRFIMCGNDSLKSKYDSTDGFYRRLLPIRTKPKDPNRKIIRNFGDLIEEEAEDILLWALQGLKKIMVKDFDFTISIRTQTYNEESQAIANHLPQFMVDNFNFNTGEENQISVNEIIDIYNNWIITTPYDKYKARTVQLWLSNNSEKYNLIRTNNIKTSDGIKRGYKNITKKVV